MKLQNLSIHLFCILLAGLELASAVGNKVKLTNIKSLTLRQGQKTTGRRLSPVSQLKCIGGDAKGLYEVDVMRCRNQGSDYGDEDVSWACTADLPKYFKLGSTDVICEGYSSSSDPYVLRGSCGVEYRLMLTDAGEEKYGKNPLRKIASGTGTDWFGVVFWIIFAGVVFAMIRSIWSERGGDRRVGRPLGGGGDGPWFGGGGDDAPFGGPPPPPYSKFPPSSTQPEGWRPGFWSGLAAGAAGSYFMGNRNREQRREPRTFFMNEPTSSPIFGRRESPPFGGGSFANDDHGEGSSRHTSTGFGQSRRR